MRFLSALLGLSAVLSTAFANTFTNPLKTTDGSDPFIVYDSGYYYLTTTTWTNIQITRSTTLGGLKTATPKVVWTDSTASRCCNVWAPEIHKIGSAWYIYYTAGSSTDLADQRPYVLKGGSSPWDTYSYYGKLYGEWGIDGTVATIGGTNYFYFSCFSNSLQSLCAAKLTDPKTLGTVSVVSKPTQSWETVNTPVNEGPQILQNNGQVFLVYSASYCWTASYCLGYLKLTGSNPLDIASWTKHGGCSFSSANGNYGPGHNGFFYSPDGTQIWNVYHADANSAGACDGTRYTEAQRVAFHSDGSPDFQTPVKLGTVLASPSGE